MGHINLDKNGWAHVLKFFDFRRESFEQKESFTQTPLQKEANEVAGLY